MEIYHLAWGEIADHYHPATGQWSGPHSRSYSTLLRPETGALFDRTAGRPERPSEPNLESHRIRHDCPEDLRHQFRETEDSGEIKDTFIAGKQPVTGTTWMSPELSFGTANRSDLWNQRRPLIAYWGSQEAPAYLRLRFLNENYDFSAAQIFTSQLEDRAVAAINFATNGGNKHVSIDRIENATFVTADLRLRVELGGAASSASISTPENATGTAKIVHGNTTVSLSLPTATLGDLSGNWETGRDGNVAWLDLVLYHGKAREFDLALIDTAVIALAISFDPESSPAACASETTDGTTTVSWDEMWVSVPARPAKVHELHDAATFGE